MHDWSRDILVLTGEFVSSNNKTFYIETFGCQMNAHDSERMHEVLRGAGYTEVDDPGEGVAEADVIVINTCSVREKAEQLRRAAGLSRLHRRA